MSRDASVTLDFGDGTYVFRLGIGQWRELQEKTGVGPMRLYQRVSGDAWEIDDIPQTIRVGLIGGGMEPVKAMKLAKTYAEDRPPLENILRAQAILLAGLAGAPAEDAPAEKKSEAPTDGNPSPTDASASPTSTDSAEQ